MQQQTREPGQSTTQRAKNRITILKLFLALYVYSNQQNILFEEGTKKKEVGQPTRYTAKRNRMFADLCKFNEQA